MKTNYSIIYSYIIKEFLISFVVAFLFFFFIFFINQLLLMAEEIFSKKVPFGDVVLFIFFSLPAIVAIAFPFASLVGSLMCIGRLSADNEIMALKALGIPVFRVFAPLLFVGIIFSLVSFITNDYFLPLGNIRLGNMYRKILYSNPAIELEPYSVNRYQNTTIITGEIEQQLIKNIVIIDKTPQNNKRIISAKEATLLKSKEQKGVVSLRLENVFSQISLKPAKGQYEYTTAKVMIYNILLKDISFSLMNPGPREMSSVDVWREILKKREALGKKKKLRDEEIRRELYALIMELRYSKEHPDEERMARIRKVYQQLQKKKTLPVKDRSLQLFELEFNKKFSFPISCLIFIFFAFPVGLYTRKSGRTVGFGLGLLMTSFYWGLLFLGHTFGTRLEFSPFLAMWFPNIFVLTLAVILLLIRANR